MKNVLKQYKIYLLGFFLASSSLFGKTISGKVLDISGKAIANALVRQEQNPAIWTKTTSTGTYIIQGTVGTQLRIGALHFETKRKVIANNSLAFDITLLKDALVENGDIYHINFDHIRPGDRITSDEIKQDFPVASSNGFYDGDVTNDRASIDPNESVDIGGQSLKIKFPKDGAVTCCSGLDIRVPLKNTYKDNDFAADELYFSYWVKFKDDWEWDKCGGKMPSLGGSEFNSREQTWKGRIMWANQGTIRFYPELPSPVGSVGYNNNIDGAVRFWGSSSSQNNDICKQMDRTEYLKSKGWHNIELHYVLDNGPGTIGYFEGWIDGEKTSNKITSDKFNYFRIIGNENLTLNAILISFFHGGSSNPEWKPDKDEYCWVDEFRVSKSRINEWSKYNIITSLEPETEVNSLSVFPNPSLDGVFNLSQTSDWKLTTVAGKELKSGSGNKINTSDCPKGIYLITVGYKIVRIINN